jgi:hypothetical protein
MTESKTKLEERAAALLQDSAEQLDGKTRSQLTQARHAALDAVREGERKTNWLLPAAGVAAAAVLAVTVSLNVANQTNVDDEQQLALTPVDELEIVTAEDSLEFYRDVEFYAWLDTVLDEDPAEQSGV